MTDDVLNHIVEHWKSNFTGVSALAIADALSRRHDEVLASLDELAAAKKVTLRPARVTPMHLDADEDGVVGWREDMPVDTHIVFATRPVLQSALEADSEKHAPFTTRLHLGDSQVKQYFFDAEVLEAYRRHPERYDLEDDVMGGDVLAWSDYYLSLPESDVEEKIIPRLRYGKRLLKNGRVVIGVIVHDLHELPPKEQMRWASYELDHPEFDAQDADFDKYQRESFEAEFFDHNDPLEGIFAIIRQINQRLDRKLFRREETHAGLHYPVTNSVEAYRTAHQELFKVIGSDALSTGALQALLTDLLGVDANELTGTGGRPKGSWALFRMLMARIPSVDFKPLEVSSEARRQSAHVISDSSFSREDFVARFRNDCEGVLAALMRLDAWLGTVTDS
jgi:hypothetical protein